MRSLIIISVLTVVFTGCTMDNALFNGSSLNSYTLSDSVVPVSARQQVTLTSENERLVGFYVRQPDSVRIAPHFTVLYHHGNRDHLQHYWDRVELLYKAGFDVFIYDYRGFGMSTGTSSEASLAADARAALSWLRTQDLDTSLIVDYGYSLGGVPATDLAVNAHRPHALILEAAFASGDALVQSGTLLQIPSSYVLEGSFNNVEQIARNTRPLLILHGTNDTFIGYARHAQALYDAAPNPKTLYPVVGAGHDNIPSTMGTQQYIDLITAFIKGG